MSEACSQAGRSGHAALVEQVPVLTHGTGQRPHPHEVIDQLVEVCSHDYSLGIAETGCPQLSLVPESFSTREVSWADFPVGERA